MRFSTLLKLLRPRFLPLLVKCRRLSTTTWAPISLAAATIYLQHASNSYTRPVLRNFDLMKKLRREARPPRPFSHRMDLMKLDEPR